MASDVVNGELNCSFRQKYHKTLLKDSLAFWFDTVLHPSKNPLSARRLKIGITTFAIESVIWYFACF